ncbi:sugar transferase [Deinococcus aerolatus]|uniref:sugar transferase n=1 Tax=Deinococcus aerolatus TaxID=522487 RepID=UPI0016674A73|nr:sugar transferase [Deinococcus aerolatus]
MRQPEVFLISRLHPSLHTRKRLNLIAALNFIDLGSATLLSLVITLSFTPTLFWTVFSLCILATWTAWSLTRERRQALALDPYARAVTTPLLAGGLLLGFSQLPQVDLPSGATGILVLLWGLSMGLARLILRRNMPSVMIGVYPRSGQDLPSDPRVHYVLLAQPHDVQLSELDALLLDSTRPPAAKWLELLTHAHTAGTPIWTPASLSEELHGRVALEHLHTARLDRVHFHDTYALFKRGFDVGAVLLALPFLLPLLVMVALLVALDAGRPVLFWQWRVGQHGCLFRIAKFRTMKCDSEQFGAKFAATGDLRVTRLGSWLRKFRLDELPQFWNVLRGDMSIIGPRPEQEAFAEQFEREIRLYAVRHWVKPGITGWAQVNQGYASGADEALEKLRYDMFYIKNFSFWLDARIVTKTLWTILSGFGAR